jgi:hypothetical protein
MTRNNFSEISMTPCGGVFALVGQIVNGHLGTYGRGNKLIFRAINRLSLWLDKRFPDTDETLLWMCISQKPHSLRQPSGPIPAPTL